eukprot:UN18755
MTHTRSMYLRKILLLHVKDIRLSKDSGLDSKEVVHLEKGRSRNYRRELTYL